MKGFTAGEYALRKVFSSDYQRVQRTRRLGNLVLLDRAKKSEEQNFEFSKEKAKSFTSDKGSTVFALTTQTLSHSEWTAALVQAHTKSYWPGSRKKRN